MRKLPWFIVLTAASFTLAAQQQDRPQQPQGGRDANGAANAPANAPDKAMVERSRVDGSAGGTSAVPPEKRKAVGAGAGPHMRDTRPSPQKLPRDEPVEPPK